MLSGVGDRLQSLGSPDSPSLVRHAYLFRRIKIAKPAKLHLRDDLNEQGNLWSQERPWRGCTD